MFLWQCTQQLHDLLSVFSIKQIHKNYNYYQIDCLVYGALFCYHMQIDEKMEKRHAWSSIWPFIEFKKLYGVVKYLQKNFINTSSLH